MEDNTLQLIQDYFLTIERTGTWYRIYQGENRPMKKERVGFLTWMWTYDEDPEKALAYELSLQRAVSVAVSKIKHTRAGLDEAHNTTKR